MGRARWRRTAGRDRRHLTRRRSVDGSRRPGAHRLPLPALARLDVDHVELDWHPAGHAPSGVFDLPHLDVRFFLVDEAARKGFRDKLQAVRVPPLSGLPRPYVPLPEFRPGAGAYWIDPTEHPFRGEPLVGTVAFGYYAGAMVFLELKLGTALRTPEGGASGPVPRPAQTPGPGAFPYRWTVVSEPGELRVTLETRPPG